MAFVVCYSRPAPEGYSRLLAIYLDQSFYELIFQHCLDERSYYAVLSVVASLRYKSPTLVISGSELQILVQEVLNLEFAGHMHPQFIELRQVCAKAMSDQCSLTVSGDMYPEL